MLILSRKAGQSLMLGDGIEITITEISGDKVKLGISAPADVKVYRKELYSPSRRTDPPLLRLSPKRCGTCSAVQLTGGKSLLVRWLSVSTKGPSCSRAGPLGSRIRHL